MKMAELKILSYNAQGIGGISKRTDIFDFLRNTNCDIYCLQETHFTDTEERSILDLWNGECLFNNYKSNARGVAILFEPVHEISNNVPTRSLIRAFASRLSIL